jgi:hypothetical protein
MLDYALRVPLRPWHVRARVRVLLAERDQHPHEQVRTVVVPKICGSSERSSSHCACHDAQSGSSPSTIRYTTWCVSPAS